MREKIKAILLLLSERTYIGRMCKSSPTAYISTGEPMPVCRGVDTKNIAEMEAPPTAEHRTNTTMLHNANIRGYTAKIFTPVRAAMVVVSVLVIGLFCYLSAQNIPSLTLSVSNATDPGEVSTALQILFLITVLALAPSILIMTTAFIRIVIVLSFLRRALGTQSLPPDQLMIGLALFMTLFVMMPVLTEINNTALQPYMAEEIQFREAVDIAVKPLRNFMLRQVTERDVALFVRISRTPPPRTIDDIPLTVIIPAFITSELKTGFIIGFILFIPFLVIDMVVASVLLSMGMMMLPPAMISMPFKIILFVMVDGWHLIVRQLIVSFR